MFSKKNIIFFAMMASVSCMSYASQYGPQVLDAKNTYKKLLEEQKITNPMLYRPEVKQISYVAARQDFQRLLKDAERTGLIAQCEKLLTEPSLIQLKDFISPEHIQVIAYMQNKYGNGNPFVYNGQDNANDVSQAAVLGTYKNPSGQLLTITRYSFFNTLLDALNKISYDQQSNPYFKKMYDTINQNLSTALLKSRQPAQQDPKAKLVDLLNKFNEFAQRSIQHDASASINIMIDGLEEIMKKATFGRGY